MDEKRKIKMVNNIFLIFTIIYLIYVIFLDGLFEGTILSIGKSLYLIGYIIFAICNTFNKKKELGVKIFFTLSTITAIATIIQFITNIGGYSYIAPKIIIPMALECLQKTILAILLFFNIKDESKPKIAYVFIVVNAIMDIVMLYQQVTVDYCLLSIVNIYMSVYLLYFNKEISEKSFRNIIIIIVTVLLVIGLFISSVTWIPKVSYDNALKKIKTIDSISSEVLTLKKDISYNNHRKKIEYDVSHSAKELQNNGISGYYSYKDIYIGTTVFKLEGNELYDINNRTEKFTVNNREFYIRPNTGYNNIEIYTNIKSNIYYVINITFDKIVNLSKKDLENLKPFFNIYE